MTETPAVPSDVDYVWVTPDHEVVLRELRGYVTLGMSNDGFWAGERTTAELPADAVRMVPDTARSALIDLASLCRGWADLLDPAHDRTSLDFEKDVLALIREELLEQADRADDVAEGKVVDPQVLLSEVAGPVPDPGQAREQILQRDITFGAYIIAVCDAIGLPHDSPRAAVVEAIRAAVATAEALESPTDSTPTPGRGGSGEAETTTGAVQAPDMAALVADGPLGLSGLADALDSMVTEHKQGEEMDEGWMQDIATQLRAHRRALLGAVTTPDQLAWISEAGETAAAERQARYQETACARRPAEERPDA